MPGSSSLGLINTGLSNPDIVRHQVVSAAHIRAVAKPAELLERPRDTWSVPRTTLTVWNLAMALFHSALASVTLALGNRSLGVTLYKTVIDFVEYEAASGEDERAWELIPTYAPAGELPFTALVAAFFILSATFHLLNATLLREFYLREIAECRTPTRWAEYFLSATVMIIVIAYTLGIRDRAVLIAIAVLVAITMPFGYLTELFARPASADTWTRPLWYRLSPWALGHLPQSAAWFLIVLQFYDGADPEDAAPVFVHAILWGELLLFFSFGGAALLSQLMPPKYFYRGELAFQVLSLASKGLLGGLLIANVIMLSEFEEIFE